VCGRSKGGELAGCPGEWCYQRSVEAMKPVPCPTRQVPENVCLKGVCKSAKRCSVCSEVVAVESVQKGGSVVVGVCVCVCMGVCVGVCVGVVV